MLWLRAKWKVVAGVVMALLAVVAGSFVRRPSKKEKTAESRALSAEKVASAAKSAMLREHVRNEADRRRDELAAGDVNGRAGAWARERDSEK